MVEMNRHECEYRTLYEGTQASLTDMAAKQAEALGRVGRLRNAVVHALRVARPTKFAEVEAKSRMRVQDGDDRYIVAVLEHLLSENPVAMDAPPVGDLAAELARHGVLLHGTDIRSWIQQLRSMPVEGSSGAAAGVSFTQAVRKRQEAASIWAEAAKPVPKSDLSDIFVIPRGEVEVIKEDEKEGHEAASGDESDATTEVGAQVERPQDIAAESGEDIFNVTDDEGAGEVVEQYGVGPQGGASLTRDPFGDDPFGDDPFGDDPFGDDPFGDDPIGDAPSGEESLEAASTRNDGVGEGQSGTASAGEETALVAAGTREKKEADNPVEPQSARQDAGSSSGWVSVDEVSTPRAAGPIGQAVSGSEKPDPKPTQKAAETRTEAGGPEKDGGKKPGRKPVPAAPVRVELFPHTAPKRPSGTKRRRASVKALPPEAFSGDEVMGLNGLTDEIRAKLHAAVCAGGPTFCSDLVSVAGSVSVIEAWQEEEEQSRGFVRFVHPKSRYRQLGSLAIPKGELLKKAVEFQKSWWYLAAEKYRGGKTYEIGVVGRRVQGRVRGWHVDPTYPVVSLRVAEDRGLCGVIVVCDDDITDGSMARTGVVAEIETMLREPLEMIFVLATGDRALDPLVGAIEEEAKRRSWQAQAAVVCGRSWEWTDGTGPLIAVL